MTIGLDQSVGSTLSFALLPTCSVGITLPEILNEDATEYTCTNKTNSIGLGVAEAFLSFGANVHIIGFTQPNIDEALSLLRSEYPDPSLTISGGTADVRDEQGITEALRALAPVDHVVYTAVDARIRGPIADEDRLRYFAMHKCRS